MVKKSINFLLYFYKHIPNYFNLLLDVVTKCDFNGKYDELNKFIKETYNNMFNK